MKDLVEVVVGVPAILAWLYGIALASAKAGTALSVCVAVVLPPYAWYLVVEHFAKLFGML